MVGDIMDKDKVYAIRGDKNWQETMTKQQIEDYAKIKTYSSYNQVPNCQGVGDMRTVAQNMAKPGILVMYVNDGNLPGGGNGVLTIRTNTTNNSAIFTFEPLFNQDTYVCHFVAEDSSNWIKTDMKWDKIALGFNITTTMDASEPLGAGISVSTVINNADTTVIPMIEAGHWGIIPTIVSITGNSFKIAFYNWTNEPQSVEKVKIHYRSL